MKLSLTGSMLWALAMAPGLAPALHAQFTSGSTGSDGALSYTTAGTYTFDPQLLGLDPAGDNVFNFTTINIAAGVTLNMPADVLRNRAVIWLAQGAVTIAGTLNLAGANGAAMSSVNPGQTRYPAMPGPGGFPGGVGAYLTSPATNGDGFSGGTTTTNNGNQGGYGYNSNQLVPLVGGSGGAGGQLGTGVAGGNGGAGGGAIRIVSTVSITVSGIIYAQGGLGGFGVSNAYNGANGSGGAIHLVAPTITTNGLVDANNGSPTGVVRFSGTTLNIAGQVTVGFVSGPLYNPPLPSGVPQVKVTSVNGTNAPSDITGSALAPDFTISTPSAVTVAIAAQYVPVGTVVTLHLSSEQGNDATVTCPALAGTLASSTASCTGVTFPQGVTITDIKAVW
jgi:hypothetical protein